MARGDAVRRFVLGSGTLKARKLAAPGLREASRVAIAAFVGGRSIQASSPFIMNHGSGPTGRCGGARPRNHEKI